MAYVEFIDVCKTYRMGSCDVHAVDHMNFSIEQGEFVVIVGPSGAGKTTVLNMLAGMDTATSGTIKLAGKTISGSTERELTLYRRHDIGFVFQFHQLLPEFTALENGLSPAYIAGKGQGEAKKRAQELLGFMGLTDRAHHKPNQLSGGEKQRVAVARALVNHPAVILADEPSGSLDSQNKAELHQLFFDLRNEFGQTFVIVTHDEGLAALTDRTIHMKDGRLIEPQAMDIEPAENKE